MSEAAAKPERRKIWKYLLALALAGALVMTTLGWYSTTDSFRALVHERFIATLERMTGGRVELGSIHVVPFHFQVEVRNLTIHGREGAAEIPYFHASSLMAQVKILSLLRTELGLNYLVLDHPVIHIILYSDGTTNQPEPKVKQDSPKITMEQIFALSINRLEVRRGELIWGNQRMPLDFSVRDVSADLSYSLFRSRYEGNILLGKGDTAFSGYRPVAWTVETHFSLGRNQLQLHSLKATSGRSRLQASGQVADFNRPKANGTYDVSLDLAEAAAVVRRPEVRRGTVQLSGNGSWSAEDFSGIGKVVMSNLDWRDAPVGVHDANINAHYNIDPKRVQISQIEGRVLSGSIAGDAEVTQWLSCSGSNAGQHEGHQGEAGRATERDSASSVQGFIRRGNCWCAYDSLTPVCAHQTHWAGQRKPGSPLERFRTKHRGPVRHGCGATGAALECAISDHRTCRRNLPLWSWRIGISGTECFDSRYPNSCLWHAFFDRCAQSFGDHHEPGRVAARIHRRRIRRTDSGNAEGACIIQWHSQREAYADRYRRKSAVAGFRNTDSRHIAYARKVSLLERFAGGHSVVAFAFCGAKRHSQPRSRFREI